MHLKINVPSALLGALAATLAFLSIGAQGINVTPLNPPVIVSGIPTPQQMMRVVESQPLTVPYGKIFVALSMGSTKGGTHTTELHIDGVKVHQVTTSGAIVELPGPGLAAEPGSVVEAVQGDTEPTDAQVWGYLADAAM